MISDILHPHSITIYNRYVSELAIDPFNPLPPSTGNQIRYDRTVIKGCSWKDDVRVNPDNNGVSTPGKSISIVIPLEAARRVEREQGKTYIKPQEFASLPIDNMKYWTLREGVADPDIIVLGEGPELTTFYTERDLRRDFKHTSPVQVADLSNQDIMPGWKVLGV